METKKRILALDIVNFVLGVLLIASLVAAVYGHLWLSRFETMPASELVTIFFNDAAQEKGRMETLRLVGGLSSVVFMCLTSLNGIKYYKLHDDPKWEAKKSIAGFVFLFVVGIVFYALTSELFLEAISLSLLLLSTFSIVGNTLFLFYKS